MPEVSALCSAGISNGLKRIRSDSTGKEREKESTNKITRSVKSSSKLILVARTNPLPEGNRSRGKYADFGLLWAI